MRDDFGRETLPIWRENHLRNKMAHATAQQKIKATKSKIQAAESLKNFSEDTA